MATEEKLLIIPLRKYWVKKTRVKRVNNAVDTIRSFLIKHTKSKEVKVSQKLNESLWTRGIKKPPARVKVKVVKDGDIVTAMLPDEKPKFVDVKKKGKTDSKKIEAPTVKTEDKKAEIKPLVEKSNESKAKLEIKPVEKHEAKPEQKTTEKA